MIKLIVAFILGIIVGLVIAWCVFRKQEKEISQMSENKELPVKKERGLTENEKYSLRMIREGKNGIKA